jgi:HAE1 family hydrophobic/amphiphilic exporter-1
VNNGIVLIDCINSLKNEGKDLYIAVVEGSSIRLRPVLMTALTTILGLVPLALGIGEGAELQSPLAITMMGGLTVATFLTLVVIPAIYLISEEFFAKLKRRPKS